MQNLLDKRSRYVPSLHTLLLCCPPAWLRRDVPGTPDQPRWRATGLLATEPKAPLVLPVRDIRVLYALKPRQFEEFACHNIAHAHEFFAPVDALIGSDSWRTPALRLFLGRAARRTDFWDSPALAKMRDETGQGRRAAATAQRLKRKVRSVGDQPVDAEADQPFDVGAGVERPGYDRKKPESLGLSQLALFEKSVQGRPNGRTGRGNRPRQPAAEFA